ncbi:MAG: tyrosine--tRNA ligase [Candidatus Paceibacterota bacterium]
MSSLSKINQTVEEILTEEELKAKLSSKKPLKHYIGFEISGKVHVGQGLMAMRAIKSLQEAGVETTCFLADWHSYINRKLGGDMATIRVVAKSYFKEALTASALCVGADPEKLNFVLASDIYNADYWATVLAVASNMTLSRSKRSLDIAGRSVGDEAHLSLFFYPAMQAADIFHMGIDIAHAGTDQRKAHVVARAVAPKLRREKPIALHHHLIQGLSKPPTIENTSDGGSKADSSEVKHNRRDLATALKMSKSKPDSAVFIHDSPDTIKAKIAKAFCPPRETDLNPIIDWTRHLIFPLKGEFVLNRDSKHGGVKTYKTADNLNRDYEADHIHPQDLKNNVAAYLIDILSPAYKHFQQPAQKKALQRLEEIRITR